MLPNELPEIINPLKLCQEKPEGTLLSGIMYVSKLTEFQHGHDQPKDHAIEVKLHFLVDANGHNKVEGYVQGSMSLTCQRCLTLFDYHFHQAICVNPVASIEAAKALPELYEPLLLNEDMIRLSDWMTEELNLALPITPKHVNDCRQDWGRTKLNQKDSTVEKDDARIFPFKKLKSIIK